MQNVPAATILHMPEQNEVAVRRASSGDLDAIFPLFDAYRQFYRQPRDPALARRFLRERFEYGDSVIFIAEGSGVDALGFAQLYPSLSSVSAARIFVLNDLFVRPEARRYGVGAQLLSAAAAFGQAAGAVRLTLSTEVTNAAAQALYERHGWKRQTDFYVYELALSARGVGQ